MSDPNSFPQLPYVPGLQPPTAPSGPAVGFSTSTQGTQDISTNRFGKSFRKFIPSNFPSGVSTPLVTDSLDGELQIELLGGGVLYVAFAEVFTVEQAYRIRYGETFDCKPIIPVWGITQNLSEMAATICQITIIGANE